MARFLFKAAPGGVARRRVTFLGGLMHPPTGDEPPSGPSADWVARSTEAGVLIAHNFDYDAEVTQHFMGSGSPLDYGREPRRVVDESGIGCMEQIAIGAKLTAAFTAGATTMHIDDATYWPEPGFGTDVAFYFMLCDPHPTPGRKNMFHCTARSGTTLTVSYVDMSGSSAFSATPQSYAIGAYAGNEAAKEWRRVFAPLPAGENGLPTDDPAASGTVPLRSRLTGNPLSVPRDLGYWQYGWYCHPSVQSTWDNPSGPAWVGWNSGGSLTPRGRSLNAAPRYRLVDGNEIYLQFMVRVDQRYYTYHAQPNPFEAVDYTNYWGRKGWALQSEVSSTNQLVMGISTSNLYGMPSTTQAPFSLLTYKAARIIGLSDYSRSHVSYQPNSPWDVAPYYANCNTSFLPSSGLSTPDGAAAWEIPPDEWVTYYMRLKPGRSGFHETEIDVKFARSFDPDYDGTYTTLVSVTDACVIYSGSGDYDFPDGSFTSATVPVMDALPGWQAFGLMGYFNISQTASIPPPIRSYFVRMAEVIISQSPIAPPAARAALPSWVPAAGEIALLTNANGGLVNTFGSTLTSGLLTNNTVFYHSHVVNDYSSTCVNPHYGPYGAIIIEGGGHGLSCTNFNGVTLLELGQDSCNFRLVSPSTTYGELDAVGWTINAQTPSGTTLNDWGEYINEPGGATQAYPAGSRHSWGAQSVVGPADGGATYGTFYRVLSGGVATGGSNPFFHPHKMAFTATSGMTSYARAGTPADFGVMGGPPFQCWVPSQRRIYCDANNVQVAPIWYDVDTGTYTQGTGAPRVHDVSCVNGAGYRHIPSRNLIIWADRHPTTTNLRLRTMDVSVSDPSWNNAARTLSVAVPIVVEGWSAICWCPDNNRLIVGDIYGDPNCIYEIEIPTVLTDTWIATRVPFTSGQTITWAPNTTYHKWDYNPKTRSIVYFAYAATDPSAGDTVYVYRPRNT